MYKAKLFVLSLLALAGIWGASPALAVQRAYVSAVTGNDSNSGSGCPANAPCRWFYTAVTVVDPGGEVVAMDTGAYGSVTLTNSISLIAAPGAYAGISVFPGATGVAIATPGVNVTIRGLTINSMGGNYGVNMTNGARLSIENCVISNFAGQTGVAVSNPATVRVVDSLVRDNGTGISLMSGAIADISSSKFLGNNYGIYVYGGTGGTTTTAAISDSVVSGSAQAGIWTYTNNSTATARSEVIRTTVANGNYGVSASTTGTGTAVLSVSESMITGNVFGMYQNGAGSTLRSTLNNTVSDNSTNASGSITPLTPL